MDVTIHIPDAVAKLRGAKANFSGTALVDTGATTSAISPQVVAALGLKSVGTAQFCGVAGPSVHNIYVVDLEFPGSGIPILPNLQVSEADTNSHGLDIIIGREILSAAKLIYDGPMGTWSLEIPSPSVVQQQPPTGPAPRSLPSPQQSQHNKNVRKAQRRARKKNRH